MKKILLSLVIVCLLGQTMAFAEEKAAQSDPFYFTIGLTSWLPSFTTSQYSNGNSNGIEFLLGPRINLMYNNFFLGGSYLMPVSALQFYNGVAYINSYYLNLILGYMFTPNIGIFAGYLSNYQTVGYTISSYTYTQALYGPGLGLTGNLPIGDAFAIYANLSWMFASFQKLVFTPYYRDVISIEAGLSYKFVPTLAVNLGYKYQTNLLYGYSGVSNGTEVFSGITLGISYTFVN